MKAGRLRHRVTIQSPNETLTAYGEPTVVWGTFATRWASVAQLSGRELFNAQQVQPEATHEVRLRGLSGVTPKMRVLWGNRKLHIDDVNDVDGRGIELVLLCQELK